MVIQSDRQIFLRWASFGLIFFVEKKKEGKLPRRLTAQAWSPVERGVSCEMNFGVSGVPSRIGGDETLTVYIIHSTRPPPPSFFRFRQFLSFVHVTSPPFVWRDHDFPRAEVQLEEDSHGFPLSCAHASGKSLVLGLFGGFRVPRGSFGGWC